MRISWLLIVFLLGCSSQLEQSSKETVFTNPILAGFYPDPSICEANGKYYLTTSSFSYFPGLPIFESSDLVNWKQIGHIMDRPGQLDTRGQRITRGLFAPAISYHDGTFYAICTHVDKGGNFIVTATNPAGPWTDPTYLPELNGIDPSLYFEGDKTFVVYNSIPPDDVSLYDGHRTIRMYEIDRNTLSVKGEQYILVNGGVDISKEPVWIEAPHLYKINEMYYLMCAEGGTGYNHSEVIFRSENITGPFEPWDGNPILTQRHLNPSRPFPVTTAGHADLIELPDGNWWAVFLACRPYGDNFYNIGRETFLTPVTWTEDGWPVINPDSEAIQYSYPTPLGNEVDENGFQYTGNFTYTDEFEESELGMNYVFLRTPSEKWHTIRNEKLSLKLRPETVAGYENPSYIGHRQQHHRGSVSVLLDFSPQTAREKAGIVAFQNEKHYYSLVKSREEDQTVIQLYKYGADQEELLASAPLENDQPVRLKIDFDDENYSFSYSNDDTWQLLKDDVDGTYLSTQIAGGFVGTTLGMYATASGRLSQNTAVFDWYSYSGNDPVFKK